MMGPGYAEDPTHKVDTMRLKKRVEIFMQGEKIVETLNAIQVNETGKSPTYYIPIEDIQDVRFIKTGELKCPYKGHANFFDIKHGSSRFEKAAWTFDRPYEEVSEIKNYIAFDPRKVQYIRITG